MRRWFYPILVFVFTSALFGQYMFTSYFGDLLGFEDALADATFVVTGEGRLDEQTLRGKAPAGVAQAARRRGLPVAAVCGLLDLTPRQLADAGFVAAYALSDLEPDEVRSIARPWCAPSTGPSRSVWARRRAAPARARCGAR